MQELLRRLSLPQATARTEADIQSDVRQLLLSDAFNLDAPRLEEQLGDGTRRRIDVAVGATVIEVKKSLENSTQLADYIGQLGGYVKQRIAERGSRYNGILTDGRIWWLYEIDPATTEFVRRSTFVLSSAEKGSALTEWVQAVLATQSNVTPRKGSIEAYLGSSSPAYAQDHAFLESLYASVHTDPTVQLKRDLWARLLRSALGTGFQDETSLFVDHTLLVLEAMAIGHAVMEVPAAESLSDVRSFMAGTVFKDAGINNVMDAGFFDWVVAAPEGEHFVAQTIRRVDVFNWHNTEHDVLKVLYESVIGAGTRKNLGEYYTPDWLAEGIVAKAVSDPLKQRVLDPACGSGTFIYHVVRRMLAAADDAGWDNTSTLAHVQEHVFGLDIHPVSIILARITYLLALGDRLQKKRDAVWVPVHLGDSIQWHQPANHEADTIRVSTSGNDLTVSEESAGALFEIATVLAFPLSNIDDASTFDRLVTDLTDRAKKHTDPRKKRPQARDILADYGIPLEGDDASVLLATFNLLCDLNAQGRDSIWGFFVRNQVRPLWLTMPGRRVDVLVGNPPWVSYRFMTPSMQSQFKAFSEARNLWHGKKLATNQDLVGLFIVRAAEKYLDDGGTFAFVTPLALLSRQYYEGFRSGKWGSHLRGHITELWDLDKVRPKGDLFPVPAGVVFGAKYLEGFGTDARGVPSGTTAEKLLVEGLRSHEGWEASKKNFTFTPTPNRAMTSTEVVDSASPYADAATQGATIVPRYLFFVEEESAAGKLGTAAGRVHVRSMRSSQEKLPWKQQEDLRGVVERRYLFDVHLGSTIVPFRTLEPWKSVLPIDSDQLLTEKAIESAAPGLRAWWEKASADWEEHKSKASKLSLLDQLDYQGKMRRQLKAPAHRVVYAASGTRLAAARIEDREHIIEHKLYWLPARNKQEALYLTAVLNAPITTATVEAYQSRGLFGPRDFDTYVWRLPIPRFDPANEAHAELAALAAEAETTAAGTNLNGVGFQGARKLVRQALDTSGISDRLNMLVGQLLTPGAIEGAPLSLPDDVVAL